MNIIVGEKCLLLFCTEAIIYSEIMQSMKMQQNHAKPENATKI